MCNFLKTFDGYPIIYLIKSPKHLSLHAQESLGIDNIGNLLNYYCTGLKE